MGSYNMSIRPCHSACDQRQIFTAQADGLLWVLYLHGIQAALHYLDDYIFFGNPHTLECADALKRALQLCEQLVVPVSKFKVEGPATVLTFLGISLDTEAMELRLPEEKLRRLKTLTQQWKTKRSCTKRDLLSLIGHLQHACLVVRPSLSQTNNHIIYTPKGATCTSPRAPECCVQVQSTVVGNIPGGMEWRQHDDSGSSHVTSGHCNLRCLRELGAVALSTQTQSGFSCSGPVHGRVFTSQ
jgi:hypothetical protein